MADAIVKHPTQATGTDNHVPGQIGPDDYNEALEFSAGNDGEILTRRASSATGAAWEPATPASVATGSVLASAGVGVTPVWSASPTLTTLRVGVGAIGAPSLAIGEATSGWYRAAANDIRAAVNGSDVARFISGGIAIFPTQVRITNNAGTELYFSGDTQDTTISSDGSIDINIDLDQDAVGSSTFRVRLGSGLNLLTVHDFGVIQVGGDAAVPANQELKSADSSSGSNPGSNFLIKSGEANGSNVAGGELQFGGGQSTGTGVGGPIRFRTALAGSTGSSVNGLTTAWTIQERYWEGTESASDPAAPAANFGRLYFRDNGSGKTQFCVRFATGVVQVLATEP